MKTTDRASLQGIRPPWEFCRCRTARVHSAQPRPLGWCISRRSLASTFYRTVARSHQLLRICLLFPFSVMVPITIGWYRVEELVHVRASDEGLLVCCDGRNHSVLEIAVGCPKANSKIKGKSPWRKNVSEWLAVLYGLNPVLCLDDSLCPFSDSLLVCPIRARFGAESGTAFLCCELLSAVFTCLLIIHFLSISSPWLCHYMPLCVKTCHSVSNFYHLGDVSGAEWSRLVDFG